MGCALHAGLSASRFGSSFEARLLEIQLWSLILGQR
jgi:hypothetical protein